jgi:O-antigen/teichoic acid export membrane protein
MILKNIAQTVGTQLLLMPFGLAAGIVTARYLGPSDRGLYTLLVLIPSTAMVFSNVGLDSAVIYLHNRKKLPLASLVGNSMLYSVVAGTLIALGLWFARGIMRDLFGDLPAASLALALVTVPLRLLNNSLAGILRAVGDFPRYNRRSLLEGILTAVAIFITVTVFKGGLTECLLVYPCVFTVVALWLLRDTRRHLSRFPHADLGVFVDMLRYGAKTYGNMLANHLHMKVDLYLVAMYLSNAEIAFYSIGVKLAERILMVPTTASTVLFPRLAAIDNASAVELTARVCRMTVLGSITSAMGIMAVGGPLLRLLYGFEYLPATRPMYVVITGVAALGVMRQLANYLKSINQHHYIMYIVAGGTLLNVVLNLILIPRFRIMGAASSSLISYVIQGLLILIIFVKLTGVPWHDVLIVRMEDLRYLNRRCRVALLGLLPVKGTA